MYARCGVVEAAHEVFITMSYIDSVSWNATIAALGHHGHAVEALKLFDQMLQEDIKPERITFLMVLIKKVASISNQCILQDVISVSPTRGLRTPSDRVSAFPHNGKSRMNTETLRLDSGNYWTSLHGNKVFDKLTKSRVPWILPSVVIWLRIWCKHLS